MMAIKTQLRGARDRIRDLASKMKGDTRFQSDYKEFARIDGSSLTDMEQILASEMALPTFRFPHALRAIYECTGGFRFQWLFRAEDGSALAGRAEIASPLEIFQREGEPQPTAKVLSSTRVFDAVSDDEMVSLDFGASCDVPPLRYTDQDTGLDISLTLDPVDYLVELAEHSAINGWQRLFASTGPKPGESVRLDHQLGIVLDALKVKR